MDRMTREVLDKRRNLTQILIQKRQQVSDINSSVDLRSWLPWMMTTSITWIAQEDLKRL